MAITSIAGKYISMAKGVIATILANKGNKIRVLKEEAEALI
ncbi:hypothetical protein PTET_a2058 [Pseudoalteromonas tetraodonis]|nr:hypothetical protein PSM_A1794 [Pseudoalteromonas sp. SM9913]ATD03431.1 hypothetical protein PTET_a2058 [Pseudoalteromonas tetraodonis]